MPKEIKVTQSYRGRFAPSPTGPLHFGSLVAAVGSYLEACKNSGEWLVRMEDLDPPREMPGAADDILRSLESFGFEWQGEVLYQSQRQAAYLAALEQLNQAELTFPCHCSRKQLSGFSLYPGNCRTQRIEDKTATAIRVRALETTPTIRFLDRIQGPQQQNISQQVGDFVIRRADGLFAYQLAVVVDDAGQGISEVVRGSDLLSVTPRQVYLQQLLGLATPRYAHLPIALNQAGEKLSKQTFAKPLDVKAPTPQLWQALRFLGQLPPSELYNDDIASLWSWAKQHWQWQNIPSAAASAPEY